MCMHYVEKENDGVDMAKIIISLICVCVLIIYMTMG